jgi:cytochrome P450
VTPQWSWATWLEVAALAAVALPTLRVSQQLRTLFPRVAALLAFIAVVWLTFVVSLARWWPTGLPVLVVLSLIVGAAAVWYARPAFGQGRGLPPGSLSLFASMAALADRDFYRGQAARRGPVFKMAQFHQPVVCVVGLERGHRLIRDHGEALGPSPQRVTGEVPQGFLRYMDHEAHAIYSPLLRQALSTQVVADALPAMRAAARHELAQPRGWRTGALDPTSILERITDASFLRVFFGVEPHSSNFDAMIHAYRPLATLRLSDALTSPARAGLVELRRLVSACSRDSSQASRSAMTELRRLAPQMPDDTCVDNLIFMWKVSASNAVGLLRWLVALLGENPEWCARLQADLRRDSGEGDLLDRVVSETLRLSQSEYLYRRVRQDFMFDGFRVPAHWLVRICVWESHRDPRIFEDPDRFDPDRFLQREHPRNTYSPFGSGRHACNGVPLTMAIAHVFCEVLSQTWNWSVIGHGTLERDFRHWSHWRPGRDLRLVLHSPIEG